MIGRIGEGDRPAPRNCSEITTVNHLRRCCFQNSGFESKRHGQIVGGFGVVVSCKQCCRDATLGSVAGRVCRFGVAAAEVVHLGVGRFAASDR